MNEIATLAAEYKHLDENTDTTKPVDRSTQTELKSHGSTSQHLSPNQGSSSSLAVASIINHVRAKEANSFSDSASQLDSLNKSPSAHLASVLQSSSQDSVVVKHDPVQHQTNAPTTPNEKQLVNVRTEGEKENFVDITEYLNLPQTEAARKLGIPTSTLSKRWKEAVVNRKWPYRTVAKLDKEIMTLLHNIPQGPDAPPLPPEIESSLGILLRKRQEELRTVVIRL